MEHSKIKILHLEDSEIDVEHISWVLKKGGIDFELLAVDSREKYISSLTGFSPDIVISDHSLPDFNSFEALLILRQSGIRIPFLLVTGHMSEEFASDIILKGADDYILKDRPNRLPIAIRNVLEKFQLAKKQQILIDKQALEASIVNFSSEAIISKTPEGIITSWNPSAERIFGYAEQEAIGRNISFIVPEELTDDEGSVMKLVTSGTPVINHETIRKAKNGTYCSVLLTASPLKDASGNVVGVATILNDISELKETLEANRKSSYRLQAILNQSMDVISTIDAEGRFVTISAACEKLWGYTPYEMINRKYIDFVCDEYKDATAHIAASIMSGVEQTNFENIYRHKNGQHIPVIWSARWDIESDLMYAVARDGRERKQADMERATLMEDMVRRNNDLEHFSQMVSHKLRAPVANIMGLVGVIKTVGIEPEEEGAFITHLGTAAQNLDEVIRNLNDILELKE